MKEQLGTHLLYVLYKNRKVCLKGIGKLQLIYQSSSIDLENKWLLPPEIWYSFTPDRDCPMDDKLIGSYLRIWPSSGDSLYSYLGNEMAELRRELREKGSCTINALGTFYRRKGGNIYFLPVQENPLQHVFFGLPSLVLPSEVKKIIKPVDELSGDSAPFKEPQIIKIQSRASKATSNFGPLIAGILVLLLTTAVLFIAGMQKKQLVRPQAVALEQTLDRKINVSPSSEKDEEVQTKDSLHSTEPPVAPADGNLGLQNRLHNLNQCIIIVGAFNRQSNVDKMIYQIVQASAFKPIVLEGPLTRVGFTFSCDDENREKTLTWARETFNEEAWLYKD